MKTCLYTKARMTIRKNVSSPDNWQPNLTGLDFEAIGGRGCWQVGGPLFCGRGALFFFRVKWGQSTMIFCCFLGLSS